LEGGGLLLWLLIVPVVAVVVVVLMIPAAAGSFSMGGLAEDRGGKSLALARVLLEPHEAGATASSSTREVGAGEGVEAMGSGVSPFP